MKTKAYILIETSVGTTREVCTHLNNLTDIILVDPVTGPYDIIATIDTDSLASIGKIVTNNIHKIPGVVRTVTCLSVL
jgi:DNA-binding Lrp family transcriptional regulator